MSVHHEGFSEHIVDGGKLRPLSKIEQENLVKALIDIGNPEMTIAFLIALTSGARIQTVFTLRLKHIIELNTNDFGEIPISVGMGTGVDTKFQKKMSIYLPTWLIRKKLRHMQAQREL
ncbi:MAG: hypothetical protein U5L01_00695 [Rheinheimera sp.]|nr:hypothetical protein [Rheinheimera sp.]